MISFVFNISVSLSLQRGTLFCHFLSQLDILYHGTRLSASRIQGYKKSRHLLWDSINPLTSRPYFSERQSGMIYWTESQQLHLYLDFMKFQLAVNIRKAWRFKTSQKYENTLILFIPQPSLLINKMYLLNYWISHLNIDKCVIMHCIRDYC